jgi:hypothetical protein
VVGSAVGHAFVSYAHVDFAYVRRLVAWLRQRGVDGWVDDEIDRGARWSEVLRERIESCAVLVLVMSPAAAESEYVRREVDLARALGKRIKPLLLEGGVIFDLGAVQYEDVRDGRMPGEVFVAGLPRRHTTVVREPRPRVQHLVGSVPHRADCFQERALLAQVRAATTGGGTAIVTQVLTGLGGVGKTQLAAAVAHELIDGANLDALVWVTARSRDDMVTTYARAGHEIRGADDSDPEAAAAIFLEWLGTTTGQWLVVLDDVADPADLTGLWPPQSLSGRVVVTTRRRDAALASHGRLIPVGVFSPRRGVHLFGGEARRPARAAGRGRRARLDVGYLPLMLGQAAAYIADQDITCAEYRRRFAHAKTLVDVVPEPAAIPDDYRVPVAAALLLSVDVADALRPAGLASPLLALLSLLDPNGIPLHIVTTGASVAYLNAHRSAGADGEPVAAQQARDAVMCLARLNFVDVEREGSDRERIRVHSLVQRAARDPAPPELIAAAAVAAGDCLVDIWPDVERDSGLVQQLRSNTDALRAYAEDQLWQPDAHPVLFRSGQSLGEAGLVGAAVDHFAGSSPKRPPGSAGTTPTPWPPVAASRGGGVGRGTRPGPPPSSRRSSPIGCGCSARTTPTPWPPATTSPPGGVRRGTRPGPPPRSRRCSPRSCGCSARTTPKP